MWFHGGEYFINRRREEQENRKISSTRILVDLPFLKVGSINSTLERRCCTGGQYGTGRLKPARETKFSGAYGDRGIFIFPVQLTTSRIGNLTRLIHSLLYVMTIHTYNVGTFNMPTSYQ